VSSTSDVFDATDEFNISVDWDYSELNEYVTWTESAISDAFEEFVIFDESDLLDSAEFNISDNFVEFNIYEESTETAAWSISDASAICDSDEYDTCAGLNIFSVFAERNIFAEFVSPVSVETDTSSDSEEFNTFDAFGTTAAEEPHVSNV
jgi:hypothetical protein